MAGGLWLMFLLASLLPYLNAYDATPCPGLETDTYLSWPNGMAFITDFTGYQSVIISSTGHAQGALAQYFLHGRKDVIQLSTTTSALLGGAVGCLYQHAASSRHVPSPQMFLPPKGIFYSSQNEVLYTPFFSGNQFGNFVRVYTFSKSKSFTTPMIVPLDDFSDAGHIFFFAVYQQDHGVAKLSSKKAVFTIEAGVQYNGSDLEANRSIGWKGSGSAEGRIDVAQLASPYGAAASFSYNQTSIKLFVTCADNSIRLISPICLNGCVDGSTILRAIASLSDPRGIAFAVEGPYTTVLFVSSREDRAVYRLVIEQWRKKSLGSYVSVSEPIGLLVLPNGTTLVSRNDYGRACVAYFCCADRPSTVTRPFSETFSEDRTSLSLPSLSATRESTVSRTNGSIATATTSRQVFKTSTFLPEERSVSKAKTMSLSQLKNRPAQAHVHLLFESIAGTQAQAVAGVSAVSTGAASIVDPAASAGFAKLSSLTVATSCHAPLEEQEGESENGLDLQHPLPGPAIINQVPMAGAAVVSCVAFVVVPLITLSLSHFFFLKGVKATIVGQVCSILFAYFCPAECEMAAVLLTLLNSDFVSVVLAVFLLVPCCVVCSITAVVSMKAEVM